MAAMRHENELSFSMVQFARQLKDIRREAQGIAESPSETELEADVGADAQPEDNGEAGTRVNEESYTRGSLAATCAQGDQNSEAQAGPAGQEAAGGTPAAATSAHVDQQNGMTAPAQQLNEEPANAAEDAPEFSEYETDRLTPEERHVAVAAEQASMCTPVAANWIQHTSALKHIKCLHKIHGSADLIR